jgi:hypothetical protein
MMPMARIKAPELRRGVDPEILRDLDDFADAVGVLTPGDCARLVAFWEAGDLDDRAVAHEHARGALDDTGRRELVKAIQAGLVDWSGRTPRGGTGWGDRSFDPPGEPLLEGGRRSAALPALADTALALAVQDRLPERDFDVLFGPWSHAIGVGEVELEAEEGSGSADR